MKQAVRDARAKAAQHCQALFGRALPEESCADRLPSLAARIAAELAPGLAASCGDSKLTLRVSSAEVADFGALRLDDDRLTAESVHALDPDGQKVFLSIDMDALYEGFERALGDTSASEKGRPTKLPLSVDLFARRIEGQLGTVLGTQLGVSEARLVQRGPSVRGVNPFNASEKLALMRFEASNGSRSWQLRLAISEAALIALLPSPANPGGNASIAHPRDALSAPFGEIAFDLVARPVDMAFPLRRLLGMTTGDVLPIVVRQNFPLLVGDITLAQGTAGETDGHFAVHITKTLVGK